MINDYLKDVRLQPYFKFLDECRNRNYDSTEMIHEHHIIPKFMGGLDEETNLIKLNPLDHLNAHVELAKCFEITSREFYGNIVSANKLKSYIDYFELNEIEDIRNYLSESCKGRFVGEKNGMFGKKHSEESLQKMRENRKGLTAGENNYMFGKTHTSEVKQRISDMRKEKGATRKGPHSEESKEKMSKTKLERIAQGLITFEYMSEPRTEEHCQKLSKSIKARYDNGMIHPMKGKTHSEETKLAMSQGQKERYTNGKHPSLKLTIHIDTGLIFESRKSAMEYFGLTGMQFKYRMKKGLFADA